MPRQPAERTATLTRHDALFGGLGRAGPSFYMNSMKLVLYAAIVSLAFFAAGGAQVRNGFEDWRRETTTTQWWCVQAEGSSLGDHRGSHQSLSRARMTRRPRDRARHGRVGTPL